MAHGVGSQVGQVKLVNKGKVTGMENTLFRLGCRQIDLDVGRELESILCICMRTGGEHSNYHIKHSKSSQLEIMDFLQKNYWSVNT